MTPQVKRRVRRVVAPLVTLAVILGLWELTSAFVSPLLVSSPQRVGSDIGWLFTHRALYIALRESLGELAVGAAIGLVGGALSAIVLSRLATVGRVLEPFINLVYATPIVITLPLMVIWVGVGAKARVMFIVIISYFPMLINLLVGLRNTPLSFVNVARSYGMSENAIALRVRVPSAGPYVIAGARYGIAAALLGMVIGEMEVSTVGVGYLLSNFGTSVQTGKLLAVISVTACLGILAVGIVKIMERTVFRWVGETSSARQ